jgi:hypothetical protein
MRLAMRQHHAVRPCSTFCSEPVEASEQFLDPVGMVGEEHASRLCIRSGPPVRSEVIECVGQLCSVAELEVLDQARWGHRRRDRVQRRHHAADPVAVGAGEHLTEMVRPTGDEREERGRVPRTDARHDLAVFTSYRR